MIAGIQAVLGIGGVGIVVITGTLVTGGVVVVVGLGDSLVTGGVVVVTTGT